MSTYSFTDLDPFESRKAKLAAFYELGINPYPSETPSGVTVAMARDLSLGSEAAVSGRIMALRGQGALFFLDLQDGSAKIQCLLKQDSIQADLFNRVQLLDIGDFVWVSGTLFETKRGELTVEVHDWKILSKALNPLPDPRKGIQDKELSQRQRYAELIINPETRKRFELRSLFIKNLRDFLHARGFMEVETPILEEIPGGADANPFKTHHDALDTDFYLRISPELHLKRLAVGGFEKIFEIGRLFRNEGMSPQHLQEFTNMEFYWAYATYIDLMDMTQEMYKTIIENTFGSLQIQRGENVLDFSGEWPRVTYAQLFQDYVGINILTISDQDLAAKIKEYREDTSVSLGRGRLMDQLYKKAIRPNLIQPQFIIDVPVEFSPLAKRKASDPRVTERVMVLVDGAEVGNGFSELNDPVDQRARFEEQEKLRLAGDVEAQRMDTDFLRALEYGMPPTAGFGLGIDRFFTLLMDCDSIRDVVFFPTMRPEGK